MMQSSSADDCVCVYNIEILNLFDPELQLNNTKPVLVLENNNKDDQKSIRKLFHSFVNDSDINKAFRSMHENVTRK